MRACTYRETIRIVTKKVLSIRFPGLNKAALNDAANLIAKTVQARLHDQNAYSVSLEQHKE